MAFWSSEKLRREIPRQGIINKYSSKHIKYGAYELAMGSQYVLSSQAPVKVSLAAGEQFAIAPGQFGLLITDERVRVPLNALAFISLRSHVKVRGLVNVSGFHVDPGYEGRLKFSVFNAGSKAVVLEQGESVFSIWFADLDRSTRDIYKGRHKGQTEIDSMDASAIAGFVSSLPELERRLSEQSKRIDKQESKLSAVTYFLIPLLISALVGLGLLLIERSASKRSNADTNRGSSVERGASHAESPRSAGTLDEGTPR
jgi:dCTP deaminase